jgi:hypothetical protein
MKLNTSNLLGWRDTKIAANEKNVENSAVKPSKIGSSKVGSSKVGGTKPK